MAIFPMVPGNSMEVGIIKSYFSPCVPSVSGAETDAYIIVTKLPDLACGMKLLELRASLQRPRGRKGLSFL